MLKRYLAYAQPGPPISYSTLEYFACKNPECDRFSCVASSIGYSMFCCPECAMGKGHSDRCNYNIGSMRKMLVYPNQLEFDFEKCP